MSKKSKKAHQRITSKKAKKAVTVKAKGRTLKPAKHVMNIRKVHETTTKQGKRAEKVSLQTVEVKNDDSLVIEKVISDPAFLNYMSKNVGTSSVDILKLLVKTSQTDEAIAAKLNVKINEIRRMLNVMNSYSFLRYDTNKDNKGWLIFKWRIDREKLCEFESGINNLVITGGMQINCNDFFMCEGCYETNRVILPFDTAFEMDFKCTACGKPLDMLSKEQTTALFTKAGNVEIS